MASSLIADVCKVAEIQPHPDADRLELVRIKNWWCVVKRDIFSINDKVVYIPPETVVPTAVAEKWGVINYCSKLPKLGDGTQPDGVRVRAARLRGVASQGLILPLENKDWEVGHSVVEYYGLSKYEPPAPVNAGEAIPEPEMFHRFTDIENIGNYTDIFVEGEEVVVDEKIHGCVHKKTKIMLPNGEEIPIHELKEGDLVLSMKENDFVARKVNKIIIQKPAKEWIKLFFDNGRELICTLDHPIMTKNNGWKNAVDLDENDDICTK